MTVKSTWYGHEIECRDSAWYLVSDGRPVKEVWRELVCGVCKRKATKEGHDACLGTLDNVLNACCGHGEIRPAYVMFKDNSVIRDKEAINYFRKLGVGIEITSIPED